MRFKFITNAILVSSFLFSEIISAQTSLISLKDYEGLVERLNQSSSEVDERQIANQILRAFYGFDLIEYASSLSADKREKETLMATFIAKSLTEILPFDPATPQSDQPAIASFVMVNKRRLFTAPGAYDFRVRTPNTRQVFVIRFDHDISGVDLKVRVAEGQWIEDELKPGERRRERVETYTLIVGGKDFLIHTAKLKAWMAMLINYDAVFYAINYDLTRDQ